MKSHLKEGEGRLRRSLISRSLQRRNSNRGPFRIIAVVRLKIPRGTSQAGRLALMSILMWRDPERLAGVVAAGARVRPTLAEAHGRQRFRQDRTEAHA